MLSIKIEKEIRHDSKVAFSLTVRQLAAVAASTVICGSVWGFTRLPFTQLLPLFAIVAIIAGAFGWVQKDGMHFENLLMKALKQIVYHNQRLRYRTVNQYVKLYNQGYAAKRAASPAKAKKKKVPKSTMKMYA